MTDHMQGILDETTERMNREMQEAYDELKDEVWRRAKAAQELALDRFVLMIYEAATEAEETWDTSEYTMIYEAVRKHFGWGFSKALRRRLKRERANAVHTLSASPGLSEQDRVPLLRTVGLHDEFATGLNNSRWPKHRKDEWRFRLDEED